MTEQRVLNPRNQLALLLIMAILTAPAASRAKEFSSVVHDYIVMFEASANKPQPSRYPQLADRVRGLFPSHGASKCESWALVDGVRKDSMTIYVEGTKVEIVAPAGEWNLSTDDKYVYEWVTGSNSGVRIKRVNEDLIALVYFDSDPSWIMASLYFEYLRSPNSFHVVASANSNVEEIVRNKPNEGFEAVYASHHPLWFYGFRIHGNEVRLSKPQAEKEIPKEICDRRLKIDFHDSDETLGRHMTFL